MAADKPGRGGSPKGEGSAGTPRHRFEIFGPVTSLEPDGLEPLEEDGEVRERFTVSVTWESVAAKPRPPAPGEAGEEERAGEAGRMEAGDPQGTAKPRKAKADRPSKARKSSRRGESPAAEAPAAEAPIPDWTHAMAGNHDPDREDAESIFLLDDAFLRKTFKEVNFPASKELVLRYVDQEQDFAWGHDRTVNLHNLITHLHEDEFRTRRDLLRAIKERLGAHPAGH